MDSFLRGWDYVEDVGLVMAGSVRPDSRTVELTTDGGKTFQHLGDIPWGQNTTEPELRGPCVVILGSFHRWPHKMMMGGSIYVFTDKRNISPIIFKGSGHFVCR